MTYSGGTTHFEGEDVLITFEKEGADTVINGQARITNFSISSGTSDIESIKTFGGNSITIQKPTGEYEVTVDYITRDSFFDEINFSNTTTQADQDAEHRSGTEMSKKRWRVTMWFLGDGTTTTSTGTVIVPKNAGEMLRYIFKDVYSASNDVEFAAEDYFKGTITLKCGATDEDGYGNVFSQYTKQQGTSVLKVLNTTAHKGILTWNTTTPAWTGSYRT